MNPLLKIIPDKCTSPLWLKLLLLQKYNIYLFERQVTDKYIDIKKNIEYTNHIIWMWNEK